jgi:glycosyltransferase involved in cell wall biosynthesis
MYSNHSISMIVPVYNEEKFLENSIAVIDDFLRAHFDNYEIVIVESGSTDKSGEICDRLMRKNTRIKVIHEGRRNGFGAAMKLGYQACCKNLVVLDTVDLPFPLEAILAALPYLIEYDCVLSYRSHVKRRGLFRRFQSAIYNGLIKTILRLKVKHVNSAFKMYRREIIQNMKLISKGWLLDAEIIYRLQKGKITFTELPVELIEQPERVSSINWMTWTSLLHELYWFIKNKDK